MTDLSVSPVYSLKQAHLQHQKKKTIVYEFLPCTYCEDERRRSERASERERERAIPRNILRKRANTSSFLPSPQPQESDVRGWVTGMGGRRGGVRSGSSSGSSSRRSSRRATFAEVRRFYFAFVGGCRGYGKRHQHGHHNTEHLTDYHDSMRYCSLGLVVWG